MLCAVGLVLAARPVSKVHLALSSDPTRMFVSWMAAQGPASGGVAQVIWGTSRDALTSSAPATNVTWSDATSKSNRSLFSATMTGLTPGSTVYYQVGDAIDGVSDVLSFMATRSAAQLAAVPLKMAWIGDLGLTNGQALPYLQAEVAAGVYDHVTHVGDYGASPATTIVVSIATQRYLVYS